MSFFRPSLLRADPFFSSPFSSSFASPSLFSPLSTPSTSFFDPFSALTPAVAAPLYSLHEWRGADDDMHRSSRRSNSSRQSPSSKGKGQAQLTDEKGQDRSTARARPQSSSTSPTDQSTQSSTTATTLPSSSSTSPRQQKNNNSSKAMTTSRPARSALFAPLPSLLGPLTSLTSSMPSMNMSLDMFSTPSSYSIHASVPGVDKSDIKLTVDEHQLTIEAERRDHKKMRPTQNNHTTNDKHNYASSSSPTTTAPSNTEAHQADVEHKYDAESDNKESTTANTSSSDVPMSDAENKDNSSSSATTSTSSSSTDPSSSHHDADDMADDDDVTCHHVESFYGCVVRRVQLPDDALIDQLTAKYEDGVVKIEVPRQQQQPKQTQRRIELQ